MLTREMVEAELRRTLNRAEALKLWLENDGDGLAQSAEAALSRTGRADIQVAPDEFVGMRKAAAVEKLLVKLGRPATIRDMVPLLGRGGLELYDEDPSRAERNLRISVRMNSKPHQSLRYDDSTDTVWLKSWDATRAG